MVRDPTPFRFENMWLKTKGFRSLVDGWWNSFDVRGASSFVVAEKLKALKIKLKRWNKEVFSRVETRKNQALENMARWDTIVVVRPLTQTKIDRKTVELDEFKRWALLGEINGDKIIGKVGLRNIIEIQNSFTKWQTPIEITVK